MALGTSLPTRLPESSGAREFYVDANTGSDSNAGTSEGAAWATLKDYLSGTAGPSNNITPTAGDIVYVKDFPGQVSDAENSVGYYNPSPDSGGDHVIDSKIGSVDDPITLRAYPGHRPIIVGKQSLPAPGVAITRCLRIRGTAAYWRIEGFEFPYSAGTGANEPCVYLTGTAHDIELYDCWVHGATDGSGIFVDTSVDKAHIYNSDFWANDDWRGGSNQSHGIYIGGANNTVVANCISRDHVQGFAMQVRLASQGTIIANNVFARAGGVGSGLVIEGDQVGTIARNNILIDNANYGIRAVSPGTTGSGNVARKNIANGNGLGHYANVTTQTYYWDWDGAGNYGTPPGDNLTSDPLLVDPDNNDFRLQGGSPGIGYGDEAYCPVFDHDGVTRIQVDAGAFAFVPARTSGRPQIWLPRLSLGL